MTYSAHPYNATFTISSWRFNTTDNTKAYFFGLALSLNENEVQTLKQSEAGIVISTITTFENFATNLERLFCILQKSFVPFVVWIAFYFITEGFI
ncbi:uncharacterized protein L203_102235 [Cryptococcus depauperatus CBS 7841]|uniref:Uncharacterized protein n=1 Tax=Cryptococcus depauperatus CBS 7841 TaxID=1295531 RepID=A0AAJ8JRE9_9TREE